MTLSRPENKATPCVASSSAPRGAGGPNPIRKMHSVERLVPRHYWRGVSVFHDGGVLVHFSATLPVTLKAKLTKAASGLPSRDAAHPGDDSGTTKKTSAPKPRRRKSIAKKKQETARWVLRCFTRKVAARRIQRAYMAWKTSSSYSPASTGISHTAPTPPTTTSTGTSHASRTSTRAAATEALHTSTATNAPLHNRPTRSRAKTKHGVS